MPSQKVLAEKEKVVSALTEELGKAQAIVFADYRGLTVEQDTQMRAALRKGNVKYKVVKNSMTRRALEASGLKEYDEIMKGPTAIAYSEEDVVMPAKIIKDFNKQYETITIKGGIMDGAFISLDEINRLASIPSKDVLYGQLVFGMISPLTKLAILLNAVKEKGEGMGVETAAEVAEASQGDDSEAKADDAKEDQEGKNQEE